MTSPAHSLRPLTAALVDAVLHLEQRAYSHPWTRGHLVDALNAGYWMQTLWSAPSDGREPELLGHVVAMAGVDEAHLLNLAVAPEHQGQGWGACLLAHLADWARGQGAAALFLEVREGNARARRLYEQQGWAVVGRRRGYYPDRHGQREDALVMRHDL